MLRTKCRKENSMEKIITAKEYSNELFGKVVNNDNVNKNQEEFAAVFSEGSPALRNLLLYLWIHGIKTKACCTGHMFKPVFRKKILWFEKPISEQEYIKNQEKKSYRKCFVSHPGYLCFYYKSDDMMKSAHALRDILSQKCPDIKFHISSSQLINSVAKYYSGKLSAVFIIAKTSTGMASNAYAAITEYCSF